MKPTALTLAPLLFVASNAAMAAPSVPPEPVADAERRAVVAELSKRELAIRAADPKAKTRLEATLAAVGAKAAGQ